MSQSHATKESVHRWDLTTFNEPSLCDACTNLIWGQDRQGFICKACSQRCHKKCRNNINTVCRTHVVQHFVLQNERDNKSKEVRLLVTCLETVRKEIHTLLESITSINTTQTKPLEVQCRHIDSIIAQCLGIEISEGAPTQVSDPPSAIRSESQSTVQNPPASSVSSTSSESSTTPTSPVSPVSPTSSAIPTSPTSVSSTPPTSPSLPLSNPLNSQSNQSSQSNSPEASDTKNPHRPLPKAPHRHGLARSQTEAEKKDHVLTRTKVQSDLTSMLSSGSDTVDTQVFNAHTHFKQPLWMSAFAPTKPPAESGKNDTKTSTVEERRPSFSHGSRPMPLPPLKVKSENSPELKREEPKPPPLSPTLNGSQSISPPNSPTASRPKTELIKTLRELRLKDKTGSQGGQQQSTVSSQNTKNKEKDKIKNKDKQKEKVKVKERRNTKHKSANGKISLEKSPPTESRAKNPSVTSLQSGALVPGANVLATVTGSPSALKTTPPSKDTPVVPSSQEPASPRQKQPSHASSPSLSQPQQTPTQTQAQISSASSSMSQQSQSQTQSQTQTTSFPEQREIQTKETLQSSSLSSQQLTTSSSTSSTQDSGSVTVTTASSSSSSGSASTASTVTTVTTTSTPPAIPSKELYAAMRSKRSFLFRKSVRLAGPLLLNQETLQQPLQSIQYVIKELINTEQDYLRDLKTAVSVYVKPLEDPTSSPIKQEECCQIFLNMEALIPLSEELLTELQKIDISKPESYNVGKIFLQLLPKFRLYTGYCHAQAESDRYVKELRKNNKAFNNFLEEAKKKTNRRDIHDFLIKPLQRITKYPLLIGELEKETDDNHPDKENLKQAKKEMENVIKHTNEVKRLQEDLIRRVRLDEVLDWEKYQKKNPNEPVIVLSDMDHLVFIKEGELKEAKKRYKLYAYLFNDLLIMVKIRSGVSISFGDVGNSDLVVKYALPTDSLVILKPEDSQNEKSLAHSFTLARTDTKFKLTLIANSEIEKQDWINKLNQCNVPLQRSN